MLEATVKELASHTKEQIDGLRNDMAAEFVKRDDDIVKARTEVLKTRNAFDNALANLDKRAEHLEEVASISNTFLYGLMQVLGVTDSQREIASRIAKERYEALKKGDWETIINQSKEKYEAPKAEPALEAEETLFSELEKKKRNKRLVAPHPGMKQLRSWALHYGMTQREFSWGMSRLGYPIRKSEGARNRDIGSCWLSPDEAERIYVEIKDQR